MCGITAYCGTQEAMPFLMHGLMHLEYRGYDSAGISILNQEKISTIKSLGKLKNLVEKQNEKPLYGQLGIGHTRWATHGIPSTQNCHPHLNHDHSFSIVHNGIIENYQEIKEMLISRGYHFSSQTDSEVIVQLLDYYYHDSVQDAFFKMLDTIKGSYAIAMISSYEPNTLFASKKDSPLLIGKLQDGWMIASDLCALLDYTNHICYLNDYETAIITNHHIDFYSHNDKITRTFENVHYQKDVAKKEGYDTFMLKEIYEQPHAIKETLRGRIHDQKIILDELKNIDFSIYHQVYFVACGTAYHACLCGSHILQKIIDIPIFTMVASEFRYCNPSLNKQTLAIFVSQSGETADTISALRLAKSYHATTLAIVNVMGSTLDREANYVIHTHAGQEIAVASTKAYTTQLIALILLAYYIDQQLHHQIDLNILQQLQELPKTIQKILDDYSIFENFATLFQDKQDAYFIARGLDYASVLEGSLKLKEVSYIHSDAYMAGELKHGPIALIENGSIVVAASTQPHLIEKTMSNIEETMARGAKVILFTTQANQQFEHIYLLPKLHPSLQPLALAIPLQIIAYKVAILKGCDVDKPRNLAKSVTVE